MSEWQVHSPLSDHGNEAKPAETEQEPPLMRLSVDVYGDKPGDVHVQWQASAAARGMDRHRLVRAATESRRQEVTRIAEG